MNLKLRHVATAVAFSLTIASFTCIAMAAPPAERAGDATENACRTLLRRELNTTYQQVGVHDARWDAAVTDFLNAVADYDAEAAFALSGEARPATAANLSRALDAVDKAGCSDPLVRHSLVIARHRLTGETKPGALAAYPTLAPRLAALKLSLLMRARLYLELLELNQLRATRDSKLDHALEACVGRIHDELKEQTERRAVASYLLHACRPTPFGGLRERLAEHCAKLPQPNWVSQRVGGRLLLEGVERQIRVQENRPDLTDPQKLRTLIAQARTLLEAAYASDRESPEPATDLIRLSMNDPANIDAAEAGKWFEAAVAAEVDHLPAWRAYAEALGPDRSGDVKEVFELGKRAVQTGRFDTPLPRMLLDILEPIRAKDRTYLANAEVWKAVATCLDGYIAAARAPAQVLELKSEKAAYAFLSSKYLEVTRIAEELRSNLQPLPFKRLGLDAAEAVPLAGLLARSPASREIEQALAAEERGDFKQAHSLWRKAALSGGPKGEGGAVIDAHVSYCGHAVALQQGQTIEIRFSPTAGMIGWKGDRGPWSVGKDGTMTCASKEPVESSIRLPLPLPTERAVQYEIRLVAGPKGELPIVRLDHSDDGEGRPSGVLISSHGKGRFSWEPMRVGGPYIGNGVPFGLRAGVWERVVVSRYDQSVGVSRVGERGSKFEKLPPPFLQGAPSVGLGVRLSGQGESLQLRSVAIAPTPIR